MFQLEHVRYIKNCYIIFENNCQPAYVSRLLGKVPGDVTETEAIRKKKGGNGRLNLTG